MKNWLTNDKFPVFPKWEYYPRDEESIASWTFHWLFLKVYNEEYFSVQLTASLDSMGLHIYARLFYLFIELAIPFPEATENWLDEKLTRRGD